jgi:hypothetical protein
MALPTDVTIVRIDGSPEPDRLIAIGTLPEDPAAELAGYGWFSAVTNHFPPEAYGPDGHRDPATPARTMTDAEQTEYYQNLIASANPDLFPPPPAIRHGVHVPKLPARAGKAA